MSRKAALKTVDTEVTELKTRNNTLRVRIDDLKTFQPLTENQKKIEFELYL